MIRTRRRAAGANPSVVNRALLLLLLPTVLACVNETQGGSGDDVFSTPKSNANSNLVLGVWETATPSTSGTYTAIGRFELRADHIVSATRCSAAGGTAQPVTVSVRVAAQVSQTAIVATESAQAAQPVGSGAGQCTVQLAKGTLPACSASTPAESRTACFALTGGQLVFYQSTGPMPLNKIAD